MIKTLEKELIQYRKALQNSTWISRRFTWLLFVFIAKSIITLAIWIDIYPLTIHISLAMEFIIIVFNLFTMDNRGVINKDALKLYASFYTLMSVRHLHFLTWFWSYSLPENKNIHALFMITKIVHISSSSINFIMICDIGYCGYTHTFSHNVHRLFSTVGWWFLGSRSFSERLLFSLAGLTQMVCLAISKYNTTPEKISGHLFQIPSFLKYIKICSDSTEYKRKFFSSLSIENAQLDIINRDT
jgi:hypothetical protein